MTSRIRKAFTLIELLVVISIISLLIAILLPALSRARGAGMTVKSTSQIRQVSLALFMYTNANKDYLPYWRDNSKGNNINTGIFWQQQLLVPGYLGNAQVFWGPFRNTAWLNIPNTYGSFTWLEAFVKYPTSATANGGYDFSGYGINSYLAPSHHDSGAPYKEYKTYRLGDTINILPTYWRWTVPQSKKSSNTAPSDVMLLSEVVREAASNPTTSSVGKDPNKGYARVGYSSSYSIYTPEGNATRAYLDGHAASRNGEDLNWEATSAITGSFTN